MDISEIEKKDFEKLKQLDRIELLLKLNGLRQKEDDSYLRWYNLTNPLCFFILFIVLISFVMYGAGFYSGLYLMRLIPLLMVFIIFIILIGTCYNSINKIGNKKIRHELKKEYFTTEVKKGK